MQILRRQCSDVGLTRAELLALPVVVDVPTAARALGLGRSTAYELARRGEFPCRVLRVGSSYRVPTAGLMRVLGIEPPTLEEALDVPPGRARAS
jgi:excisionase family DNA binding protein